jgi:cytochrome c-type biogenesis protein CcmF
MIPELGQVALLLALAVAIVQSALPIAGAARGHVPWMMLARPAAQTQCLLIVFAFAALAYAFANNDFSVLYVASNSNSALPLHYRIAGVWGGHEGSLLLWLVCWRRSVQARSRLHSFCRGFSLGC